MLSAIKALPGLYGRLSALQERDDEQMRRMNEMQHRLDRMRHRLHTQTQHIATLERDLQEQRALSMRVAQLVDIVQELLIPVVNRDEDRLKELLDIYAKSL